MLRNICLVALAVALIAVALSAKRQREEDQREIAALTAQNAALSNELRQIPTTVPPSTNEAWSELLKLRAKVAELTRDKRELEARREPAPASVPAATTAAEPVQTPIVAISADSLAFAGYDTPQNAYQSLIWSMKSGNVSAFLASLTPEALAAARTKLEGKSDSEIATLLQDEIHGLEGIRLDRIKSITDTDATFVLDSRETDKGTIKIRDEAVLSFKKVGNEWKAADAL